MNALRLISLSLVLSLVSCTRGVEYDLKPLDDALRRRPQYEKVFLQKIAEMEEFKASQTNQLQVFNLNQKLAEELAPYSFDRSRDVLNENLQIALDLGDHFKEVQTNLALATLYQRAGYFQAANEIVERYSENDIPSDLLCDYYDAIRGLASEEMSELVGTEAYNGKASLRDEYRDKILALEKEGTWRWALMKYGQVQDQEGAGAARPFAAMMLEMSKDNMNLYATACYFYSRTIVSDKKERVHWLVESAVADMMTSTRDYASLSELTNFLFDEGKVDLAFMYGSKYCLPDAIFYNGRLRPLQLTRFFPAVEMEYERIWQKRTTQMGIMVAALVALIMVLVGLTFYLRKRNRQLASARKKLNESHVEIQREYITQFLGILSENINADRKYKNHVLKYIRMGNAQSLQTEIEFLPPIEEDIEKFYKMFDSTFVSMFPDFVEKFNALLREDARIEPKGDDLLTPELRIFALIRLGVKDSGRIASMLHYSSNTIYNYRAKIKNKAIVDRDSFEELVENL